LYLKHSVEISIEVKKIRNASLLLRGCLILEELCAVIEIELGKETENSKIFVTYFLLKKE
jgi:hypothetical protein